MALAMAEEVRTGSGPRPAASPAARDWRHWRRCRAATDLRGPKESGRPGASSFATSSFNAHARSGGRRGRGRGGRGIAMVTASRISRPGAGADVTWFALGLVCRHLPCGCGRRRSRRLLHIVSAAFSRTLTAGTGTSSLDPRSGRAPRRTTRSIAERSARCPRSTIRVEDVVARFLFLDRTPGSVGPRSVGPS